MPEVKYFKVTQTREVLVCANDMADAIDIGRAAFKNGQNSDHGVIDPPQGIWGNTTKKIRIKRLEVEELHNGA